MQTILLIRHGLAEDPSRGAPDADRPLITVGWAQARAAMKGLVARGYVPNRGASSPYRRAVETLQCLREAVEDVFPIEEWEGLVPQGAPRRVEEWLRAQLAEEPVATLALVSHQPLCSELILHLTGQGVSFPNAACAVLEFDGACFRLVAHFTSAELLEGA